MTPSCLRRLKQVALGLASAALLFAQVDPNLATATDLLDVYKSGSVRPEIMTMFDFSGSMSAVFWHSHYWTSYNQSTYLTSGNGDDDDQLFSINTSTNTVTLTPAASSTTLTSLAGTGTITGFLVDSTGTKLGTPISLSGTNPILGATHVRLTWTQKFKTSTGVPTSSGSGTATFTRTVDVPFCWTVHKAPGAAPVSNAPLSSWIDGIADTDLGSSNNYIPYDTIYKSYTTLNNFTSAFTGTYPIMKYNSDYLYWIFWGVNTKGTGGVYSSTASSNAGPTGTYTDDGGQQFGTGGFVIPGALAVTSPSFAGKPIFANGLPTGTRAGYLKKAVLTTWFANRTKVWWAYRFLDTSESNANSTNYGTWGVHTNRELTLLKPSLSAGASDPSVTNIQSRAPSGGTPLTYAMANSLAQMDMTGTSIFDQASTAQATGGSGETPPPCRSSWIILFTDGIATDSPGSSGGAWATEAAIQADLYPGAYTKLNPGQPFWNIWSLAAVAAHGTGTPVTTNNTGTNPSNFAPFQVSARNANPTRKITTMTVGLSMGGTNTDASGGKAALLKTAVFGDPSLTGFNINNAVAYGSTAGTQTNFFDASNPSTLITSLSTIFARAVSGNTGITAPAAPLVGLSLGTRAFLGRFQTSNDGQGGNSIWKGDLLMAGLGIQSNGVVGFKDFSGNWATDINAATAVASAYNAVVGTPWPNRNVYTVIPGNEPTLGGAALDLTDAKQSLSESNPLLTASNINIVMGTPDAQSARTLIRFLRGASPAAQNDTATPTTKTGNRTDIMGDIINSSPAAVEFDSGLLQGTLLAAWGASYGSGNYKGDARFHVIFVGDNQGLFHAFGVVSGFDAGGVLHATMQELWAFLPPEFLNSPSGPNVSKLSQLQGGDPTQHIYTVDGSPLIYFHDAPLSGSSVGNFKVDGADQIRVIVGLRKGGRSYYAFDVLNPYAPKLAWVLNPNTSTDATIKTMGLATSSIGLSQVQSGSTNTVQEVVILGGGYSDNILDTRSISGNPAAKLGRSLLAMNVLNGAIVKKYDFVNNPNLSAAFPNIGAISAGGFPFQFITGSNMTQRVYFGDQFGGVYALGSMKKLTTTPINWRIDSSNVDQWTSDGNTDTGVTPAKPGIRWIYKGATTVSSGSVTAAAPVTSIPVAYLVPTIIPEFRRPASDSHAPNMIPPVVGVTFGTGDRNDPMDLGSIHTASSASLRQVMVFDRQDSADLPSPLPSNVDASAITDAQLSDQTATNTVGTTSYLGNQYLGYYLKFGGPNTDPNAAGHMLYPKSYLSSIVLSGSLFFSIFTPTSTGSSTLCSGSGQTVTYRMCNAIAPVFSSGAQSTSNNSSSASCSGFIFTWANLAGSFTGIGNNMILQSGQDNGATSSSIGNARGQSGQGANVTTAFAPRSWRIVR